MTKSKEIFLVLGFTILAMVSVLGNISSFLIFPAIGLLSYFLIKSEHIKPEIQTIFIGACLIVVFLFWYYIRYDNYHILYAAIYTLSIMAAIEAWRFSVRSYANLWGLMNLVIYWLAMEYIMLVWLPFDITTWIIGAPLFNSEWTNEWVPYVGYQGYSLWTLVGGILLFKSFEQNKINILLLLPALLFIFLPAYFEAPMEDTSMYAQGEWVGRTSVWVSVLLLAYSFVKRRISKK